jgi:hypothetical protein
MHTYTTHTPFNIKIWFVHLSKKKDNHLQTILYVLLFLTGNFSPCTGAWIFEYFVGIQLSDELTFRDTQGLTKKKIKIRRGKKRNYCLIKQMIIAIIHQEL